MPGWYAWQQDALILQVYVQTRASRDEISGVQGDQLKIRITAAPVDGKANTHLIAFIARQCGINRSAVRLISGSSSRRKRLRLALQKTNLPEVLARFDNSVEHSGQN